MFEASYATIIPVRKMDRALAFYTETLGGKLLMRGEGDMKNFWASVKVAGSEFWLVPPEGWEKRKLSYSVFVVKDIKSAVGDLQAKGVKFQRAEKMSKETKVEGPVARDPAMGASAFFKDSEGNLLMLWESM
jgi:predicted enzyme related to lactoylglutathione lyase